MWNREPLNLESKYFPNDRGPLLLGSIAIARKFQNRTFFDREASSYLICLYHRGIPVYGQGVDNPTFTYYRKGVLKKKSEKCKLKGSWVNQYRVIMSRIEKIEQELKKTELAIYLEQLNSSIFLSQC
jgi:hypothetical protein